MLSMTCCVGSLFACPMVAIEATDMLSHSAVQKETIEDLLKSSCSGSLKSLEPGFIGLIW